MVDHKVLLQLSSCANFPVMVFIVCQVDSSGLPTHWVCTAHILDVGMPSNSSTNIDSAHSSSITWFLLLNCFWFWNLMLGITITVPVPGLTSASF